MAKLLSFPFRVPAYGAAVAIEQGDETYYGEQMAVILLTHEGERLLQPSFGMPDMAFNGFQFSAFQTQVEREMPEVASVAAKIVDINETTEKVVVEFSTIQESA